MTTSINTDDATVMAVRSKLRPMTNDEHDDANTGTMMQEQQLRWRSSSSSLSSKYDAATTMTNAAPFEQQQQQRQRRLRITPQHSERRDDTASTMPSTAATTTTTTSCLQLLDPHHTTNNYSNNSSSTRRSLHSRRKRRRRRSSSNHDDDTDDPTTISFGRLFLRVGLVVCFIGYALYQTYQRFFSRNRQPTMNTDDDDDDVTNFVNVPPRNRPFTATTTNNNGGRMDEDPMNIQQHLRNYPVPNATTVILTTTSSGQLFDAYSIAELYEQQQAVVSKTTTTTTPQSQQHQQQQPESESSLVLFWQTAAGLRTQFAELYGGMDAARIILQRATSTFGTIPTVDNNINNNNTTNIALQQRLPDDLIVTACRMWSKKHDTTSFKNSATGGGSTNNQRNQNSTTATTTTGTTTNLHKNKNIFHFVFGGYSVTVGRGNLFTQSYPMVLERQLQTIFGLLGISLQVRNAAIGGCLSFPYGFCTPNFWGERPDVVSWDYSMNEAGGDPVGLEAYMRHIMKQYPNQQPKLIVKDTHMAFQRRELLQYYYNQSQVNPALSRTTRDPVVIHTEPAVEPFLKDIRMESDRPIGFQEWRKFGTPPNSPGQSAHHPAVKEHEFIAWIITMHFLTALEVVALAEGMDDEEEAHQFLYRHCPIRNSATGPTTSSTLPEPMYAKARNSTKLWNSILFGEPDGQNWKLNNVRCRTSFEPIVSGDLSDAVVSGGIGEDLDVMLPKSKMFYNSGWVLDLGDDEKKAKRNLDRFTGHGFNDNKKAYYGIYGSGSIQLFLPYESTLENTVGQPSVDDEAHRWFKSIVTCEVNEKRRSASCNSLVDIHFDVGGMNATQVSTIDTPATSFFGKKLCTHIMVPELAKLTTIAEIKTKENFDSKRSNLHHSSRTQRVDQVGLLLTLTVSNRRINRRDEACSVSHVVWEQR